MRIFLSDLSVPLGNHLWVNWANMRIWKNATSVSGVSHWLKFASLNIKYTFILYIFSLMKMNVCTDKVKIIYTWHWWVECYRIVISSVELLGIHHDTIHIQRCNYVFSQLFQCLIKTNLFILACTCWKLIQSFVAATFNDKCIVMNRLRVSSRFSDLALIRQ